MSEKIKMRTNLMLTCAGYFAFGFGFAVEQMNEPITGWWRFGIFASCLIFFVIVVFTSMEKLKRKLYDMPNSEPDAQVSDTTKLSNEPDAGKQKDDNQK